MSLYKHWQNDSRSTLYDQLGIQFLFGLLTMPTTKQPPLIMITTFQKKTAEQYCTNIDITLNNVIAENDDKQGAIVEPSPTGFMFYRDETQIQYKSNDETLTLTLQKPIHKKIKKLICRFKKVFIRLERSDNNIRL